MEKIKTVLAILGVIGFFVLFHYLGFLHPIENNVRSFIGLGSSSLYSWSITLNDETQNFDSVADLENAYKQLKEKFAAKIVDNAELVALREENDNLRKNLNFKERAIINSVGADVIGREIDSMGSTIIINRGKDNSIRENDPVITAEGILVGKVAVVNDQTTIVRLITDNQSRVAVTVLNQEKSIGLVEGGYGLSVRMTFVPQHEELNIGDIVVTSGLEKELPHGLTIGLIESVEKEVYEPFQRAIITSPVNLQSLRHVSVLLAGENGL